MSATTAQRPEAAQTASQSSMQSHPFTCVTCAIAFRSSELQRGHMRSDWHRYNLKRRVASLPPLSSEIFAEKVLSAQANKSAEAAKASFEKSCGICQKTYYSENAFQNHLGSQKHKANVMAHQRERGDDETNSIMSSTISLGEPLEASEHQNDPEVEAEFSKVVDAVKNTSLEDEEPVSRRPTRPHPSAADPLLSEAPTQSSTPSTTSTSVPTSEATTKRCLFCNYDSPTFKLNVNHMTKFHGMFIPEQSYLVDLEGLVAYLQAKILENSECLFCHKLKNTPSAVQTHMRDKGHCMIAFDTEEEMIEVGQFYDFRSTYSDEETDSDEEDDEPRSKQSGGVKLGARRASGDSKQGEDEGWETDSSADSVESDEIGALPIDHDHAYARLPHHRHHSHHDPRPHRNADGFHSHAHSHHAAFHSDHELHLPSGRTAGHRSLARYYRQNLHNIPTFEEREQRRLIAAEAADVDDDEAPTGRQLTTRANGGTGMIGVSDAKKKEILAVEKREQKKAQRAQNQYMAKVERRQNKQKHFRDDNFGTMI